MIEKLEKIAKNLFIIGISFSIIFIFLNAIHTEYHENTHKAVCKYFGSENITIEYTFLRQGGKTFCQDFNITETFLLAHSQVEIEGYNQVAIIMALSLLNSILIAILFK